MLRKVAQLCAIFTPPWKIFFAPPVWATRSSKSIPSSSLPSFPSVKKLPALPFFCHFFASLHLCAFALKSYSSISSQERACNFRVGD
jgi:hypothetical protein